MAGDDQRDGVVAYRSTNSLSRKGPCSFLSGEKMGNVAVGHGMAVRDGEQNLPYALTEIGSTREKGRGEVGNDAGKIKVEPMASHLENRQVFTNFMLMVQRLSKVLLPVKPKSNETAYIAGHHYAAKRRVVMGDEVHFQVE